MAQHKAGLGKGLGALIQRTDPDSPRPRQLETSVPSETAETTIAGARFAAIPVEAITPNPQQPRLEFDEDELRELVASIREVGVLQPVVVRPAGDAFELVMGERRLRAAKEAGLATIPAIVRDTDDDAMLRDALLENLHRSQLNPLEEAAAYQQMLQDFGCSKEELAERVKRSRPHISNTLRLLNLPAPVQRRVAAGVLSAGHARALLALTDPVQVERLAQRVVAEGLSVRGTEEAVALAAREQTARPRSAARTAREPSERAVAVANELSDRFETRVRVDVGCKRGQVVIEFAGEDDLERILSLMGNAPTSS